MDRHPACQSRVAGLHDRRFVPTSVLSVPQLREAVLLQLRQRPAISGKKVRALRLSKVGALDVLPYLRGLTNNSSRRLRRGLTQALESLETWQPITIEQLEAVVAAQLGACAAEQQAAFASLRVQFFSVPISRLGAVESVLVVARLPSGLLYFEDVEEGFEIGVPGADGVLPDQGCNQLELRHVLTRAGL